MFYNTPIMKCVLSFKTKAPGVPLPSDPELTRWGTWIEAISYYCQYFKQVRNVMQHFDSNDLYL